MSKKVGIRLKLIFKITENIFVDVKNSQSVWFILQDILQSHPFLMPRNFEMQGCQWYGVKRIQSISEGKGNSWPRFRATVYYLREL